jgi:hypothetical protein
VSKGAGPAIASKSIAESAKVRTIQGSIAIAMKKSDPAHFRIAFRPVVSAKIDA